MSLDTSTFERLGGSIDLGTEAEDRTGAIPAAASFFFWSGSHPSVALSALVVRSLEW